MVLRVEAAELRTALDDLLYAILRVVIAHWYRVHLQQHHGSHAPNVHTHAPGNGATKRRSLT